MYANVDQRIELVSLRLKLYARCPQYFGCRLYLSMLEEVMAFFKMPNFFGSGYAGLGNNPNKNSNLMFEFTYNSSLRSRSANFYFITPCNDMP